MSTALSPDQLAAALALRDLTDPAAGRHAVQLVVDRLETALAGLWGVPVVRHPGPRVVLIKDNYDRLRYRPHDVTRGRRYTRYLDGDRMLRSHTTAHIPGLLRSMAATSDGVLLSVPGMCYRRDVIDRHHVATPHQLDLWLIRRGGPALGETDLRAMVAAVTGAVLPGAPVDTPASPHPYTLSGREIYAGGVEVGECGIAHPDVLRAAGLGDRAAGLAMGLGLDRLVMLVKGVPDIRLLRAADPRVAAQMGDLNAYRPVSAMPPVRRDLSLAVDEVPDPELVGDRVRELAGMDAGAIESVRVLSVTAHADLPEAARERMGLRPGQLNVLLRLVLRDHDRTLTDAEANRLRDRVYAGLHRGRAGEWVTG